MKKLMGLLMIILMGANAYAEESVIIDENNFVFVGGDYGNGSLLNGEAIVEINGELGATGYSLFNAPRYESLNVIDGDFEASCQVIFNYDTFENYEHAFFGMYIDIDDWFYICQRPDNRLYVQWNVGGSYVYQPINSVPFQTPIYFKIQRMSNGMTGYYSFDNQNWTTAFTKWGDFDQPCKLIMGTVAVLAGTYSTATFSDLKLLSGNFSGETPAVEQTPEEEQLTYVNDNMADLKNIWCLILAVYLFQVFERAASKKNFL